MLSLFCSSAKAQVFVNPTMTDQFLANVTTSVLGTPASSPDDVTINCDMLSDAHARPIKGIAWDEGTRSNQGHLYFEDGHGNDVFLQFHGVHPDIVLGNSDNLNDYRAAVVYILRVNATTSYPMIDFYDLTGLGTTGFTATHTGTLQLSTTNLGIIYDTDPIPHIDMWSDDTPGAQINGYPAMREFAVSWNEGNDVHYNWGRIGSGTVYLPLSTFPNGDKVNQSPTHRTYNDVACYTNLLTGQKLAVFCYNEWPNGLVVYELDFTSASPTATFSTTTNFWQGVTFPRIEAMSQYDPGNFAAPWDVVASRGTSCWEYNIVSFGTDISTTLLAGGHFMSTAIAAGIGNVVGEPTIGNIQFTPGYLEWWGTTAPPLTTSINYYARAVDPVTGSVIDPDYYIINTNAVAGQPTYSGADVSKGLALSNCSNSGDYLLSVWYNDANGGASGATGDIWFKLSGNTVPMQFRIGQIANVQGDKTVYPNPATDKVYLNNASGNYSIYNLTGLRVTTGNFSEQNSADISGLASGMYLLKAEDKTYKFTKK